MLVATKVSLLVLFALTVQQAVLDDLRVGGVQPDVMLLWRWQRAWRGAPSGER
jgi:hypothetical protein